MWCPAPAPVTSGAVSALCGALLSHGQIETVTHERAGPVALSELGEAPALVSAYQQARRDAE